jgi:hypothetical protein
LGAEESHLVDSIWEGAQNIIYFFISFLCYSRLFLFFLFFQSILSFFFFFLLYIFFFLPLTETVDAAAVSQSLGQGLAHSNPHIFVGVVIIDMGVTHRMDLQIDQAVAADLMEHVVEEGHAGAGLALAGAIQFQTHLHVGFTGDPMDLSLACHHSSSSAHIVPHIPVTQ